MADSSEYGVPQFKCEVKQKKEEHDEHTYEGHEETDSEACEVAAASMTATTKGIEN